MSPTTNNTTPVGRLHVRVVEARNVANPKLVGMPETFVTLSMDGQQIQYTSIINSNTPKWDQVFHFDVANVNNAQLRFDLRKKTGDVVEHLGIYVVRMAGRQKGKVKDSWLPLLNSETKAELRVRICPTDFGEEGATISDGLQVAGSIIRLLLS